MGEGEGGVGSSPTHFEPLPSYLHYRMVCYGQSVLVLLSSSRVQGLGLVSLS